MEKVDQALSYFEDGFNCAQSIFATYSRELGLERAAALKICSAFGGGMARTGATCGAVSGTLMIPGLKYAKGLESKEQLYGAINEFIKKFKARNNSLLCCELLGHAINTPEGMKAIQEKELFKKLCPRFVQDAAEILEEIMHDKDAA